VTPKDRTHDPNMLRVTTMCADANHASGAVSFVMKVN